MPIIESNSEILYLYDARLTNPNGDPDDENRPRMDYEARRNLVSDVRLKRYLRDYWLSLDEADWRSLGYDSAQDVWVRKIEEEGEQKVVSAKQRIDQLAQTFGGKNAKALERDAQFRRWMLERLVDVRAFGATMPIGDESGRGGSVTLTGAVQFSWGYSLNHADILSSSTITAHFAGRETEDKGAHGTMGKDWRIKYSLVAFYGTISAWRAKYTLLTPSDVNLIDKALLRAIPAMATTRSKIGQTPRLLLRVQYTDKHTFLGDLRDSVQLESQDSLESIHAVNFSPDTLRERLTRARERIASIVCWSHPDFAAGIALQDSLRQAGLPLQGLSG